MLASTITDNAIGTDTVREYPKTTDSLPLHLVSFNCFPLNVSLTTVTLIGGGTTVLLNLVVFSYYRSRNNFILNKVFMFLSGIDTMMGMSSMLHSLTILLMVLDRGALVRYVLPVTAFLSSVSTHVSAFYNILLAVIRTISITSPFFTFNQTCVYVVAGLYPVFWAVMATYEVYSVKALYSNYTIDHVDMLLLAPLTGSELIFNLSKNTASNATYFILLLGIPFVIPSVIGLACCVLSLVAMKHRNHQEKEGNNSSGAMARATITVIQLTVVFFICNTLFFVVESSLHAFLSPGVFPYEMYVVYMAGNLLPFINSLINPIIMIRRGTMLRRYLQALFRRPVISFEPSFQSIRTYIGSHGPSRSTTIRQLEPRSPEVMCTTHHV